MKKKIDLHNIKTRNALVILVLGLLIGGYLYYQFIGPGRAQVDELKTRYNAKQAELNQIKIMKTRLNKLAQEIVADSLQLDSLRQKFPDEKEIPRLIQELTKVGGVAGVYTVKFQPLPDVVKEYYIENRYAVTVEGGYHDLAEFFSYLANMPLIINLSNVAMRTNGEVKTPSMGLGQPATITSRAVVEERTVSATFEMTTFSSKK
jgi:type IV pilus assembly protein PilO